MRYKTNTGKVIAENVAREKVFAVLEFVLEKYRQLGEPHERLCKTIDRVGLEQFIPPEDLYASDAAAAVDEDFANFLFQD